MEKLLHSVERLINLEITNVGVENVLYETRALITALMIMAVALALSGCASMEGKLAPSTNTDVGYFTDRTITILRQAEFMFTRT